MSSFFSSPSGLLTTLLAISFIVFVHELGHWLMAQWCGIRTTTFSIGFGTPRWCFARIRETNFYISPWIFGGYVEIPDLDPEASLPDVRVLRHREPKAAVWKRILVACAGVAMNVITATSIAFVLLLVVGETQPSDPQTTPPVIDHTVPGYPAKSADFLLGDKVISVDGVTTGSAADVQREVSKHPNAPVEIIVQRDGQPVQTTVTANDKGKIGIAFAGVIQPVSALTAAQESLRWTWNIIVAIANSFFKTAALNMHGPVGVMQAGSNTFQHGSWYSFGFFVAYLNLAIGFINILPLPVLDGGHVVLLLLEKLRGKSLSPAAMSLWNQTGIAMFVSLFILGTWNDFLHPIN